MMLVFQLALPGYFMYRIWRGRDDTRTMWWLSVAYSGLYVLLMMLTGRWDWLSYYLRILIATMFVVAVGVGYIRTRGRPWLVHVRPGAWPSAATPMILIVGLLTLVGITLRGFYHPGTPVQLDLPLRDGAYYVGQGGNSALLNYHHPNRAQRYAVDLVQLNARGARASRVHSRDPDRYVIFGARVYSPCDGTVVNAVDGLPDQEPPAPDVEHPPGNHIVIACGGVRVVLAHLQRGSVTTQPGRQVTAGLPLARVGNSGNTSEPHLHVHAVRGADHETGEGVPIVFGDVFPVRNTILRD